MIRWPADRGGLRNLVRDGMARPALGVLRKGFASVNGVASGVGAAVSQKRFLLRIRIGNHRYPHRFVGNHKGCPYKFNWSVSGGCVGGFSVLIRTSP